MPTTAILPVKSFPAAKQRLRDEVGPSWRESLVQAMFADVLRALCATAVDQILVVTTSPAARQIASAHGASVLSDTETGHNAAAMLGIEAAVQAGADRALLVPGDCPVLDPGEVDELLGAPATPPCALIVPDRHGTGTNALLLDPPDALTPSFGPGSCRRHVELARAAGIHARVVQVPSLALDIDTGEDLEALEQAGGHPVETRRLLRQLSRC